MTLLELKNILKMDLSKFETYSLRKGYKFDGVSDEENVFGHTYTIGEGERTIYLTLYVKHYDNSRVVTYQTSSTKEYLSLKTEIESNGFKITKTETFDGAAANFYSNQIYDLRIFVSKGDIADNVYEINLVKKQE
jgi:hypothetical protein